MSVKLTGTERSWILYDVGNSAFTLMLSTIIPIYFNSIAGEELSSVDYLAYWGYAASIATIACALLGPVLGAVADRRGMKIRLFSCALAVGTVGCAALGFVNEWLVFLIVLVITRLGYSLSLVFYDSMLVDVTDVGNMHRVSAAGYAWGYIGSCIPFVVCLVLILGCDSFGLTMGSAMTISLIIIAAWWVIATIPLLRRYRQTHFVEGRESTVNAFRLLAGTIRNARAEKKAFAFLIAFFFFIDGVYTIIEMATAYGEAIGLDSTMLLIALLVTQIVAFPCTIAFGRLAQGRSIVRLLMVCIAAYACITVYASTMENITQFFMLAVCVGIFQGGIQAMSRSYFSQIIPPQKAGEFFGLMDIFGKGASFMGTFMVSAISQLTGSMSAGILSLVVLFVIGLLLLIVVSRIPDSDHSATVPETS
ncbi:MAG TPA: MFS transporter [Euryarchaeota archaeon]|nr:MFS transporter [Euryarchaeota archaeon]